MVVRAGFPIQGSRLENYRQDPELTQPFILLRSIKQVPGTPGDLMVKNKLSPGSGCAALRRKNVLAPFFGWGSTASRLQSHYEEAVYFVPLCSQNFQVLI